MTSEPLLIETLSQFARTNGFRGKSPLCVALVITEQARKAGFPLDPEEFLAESGTQVKGLGTPQVQAVLKRHGIERVLAKVGGRTSRGSVGKMRAYIAFLNKLAQGEPVQFDSIESFWVHRVEEFFAAQPFKIKLDESKGLRIVVRDVLAQAVGRQKEMPGVTYIGAVLQHLVGAKLECAMAEVPLQLNHFNFTTADAPTDRAGDFLIGDVAIHVTASPGEDVIRRCQENLDAGFRPAIVTLQNGLTVADGLAFNFGIADRLDIFEIEQFVALNLYEMGKFKATGRRTAIEELVDHYNAIIDEVETDPSLRIALHR